MCRVFVPFWLLLICKTLSHSVCHLTAAILLSFGSKLCREELEHLRSDVNQLKALLSELHSPLDIEPIAGCCLKRQRFTTAVFVHNVCSSVRLLTERQGDDVSVLQAEARETSRHYERSCKVHRSPVMRAVSACMRALADCFCFKIFNLTLWRADSGGADRELQDTLHSAG